MCLDLFTLVKVTEMIQLRHIWGKVDNLGVKGHLKTPLSTFMFLCHIYLLRVCSLMKSHGRSVFFCVPLRTIGLESVTIDIFQRCSSPKRMKMTIWSTERIIHFSQGPVTFENVRVCLHLLLTNDWKAT